MNTILVLCPCGHKLGHFSPPEDNGGVDMQCPSCKTIVSICNGMLTDLIENPENYEPNDRYVADPISNEETP